MLINSNCIPIEKDPNNKEPFEFPENLVKTRSLAMERSSGAALSKNLSPQSSIEKTLNSQLIYDGPFLKVHQDDVLMSDGHKTKREFVKHPGASLIVPVFDDFETMIVEQYRYPLKTTFIEFPAGKMDPGEDSLTTAKRELLEETGLIAKKWDLLTLIHPVIGYSDEVIYLYLARMVQQSKRTQQSGENLILKKVSFQWLFQRLVTNELTDVKTQIALFWAEKVISGQWKISPLDKKD